MRVVTRSAAVAHEHDEPRKVSRQAHRAKDSFGERTSVFDAQDATSGERGQSRLAPRMLGG